MKRDKKKKAQQQVQTQRPQGTKGQPDTQQGNKSQLKLKKS